MKNKLWISLMVCFVAIYSGIGTCYGMDIKESPGTTIATKQNDVDAKKVLKDFLYVRSEGKYKQCVKYLTKNFTVKFKQTHGTDFVDYFRNQNEDYFRQPRILKQTEREDGTIIFDVVVRVEGPGYITDASETYSMILDKGKWKIDDWQIKYSDKP